jgi:hypothetical protein
MDVMNPQMQVTDVQVEPKVIIHDDHEISMSQAQCYKAAKNAMEIHKLLKMVDNLESWMQAKITLAAEYLECVASNLEYDVVSATLNEGTHEPVQENVDFPYTTAQLVKLGQKIFVRLPSITHDATANKLSALADKLVHLGGTFAEPLNDDDKKLVLSLVQPKKSDDINWSDPSKWPHKMAEAYKPTSPVDSESARRGALTRALKQLETGLKKSHPRTQLPSLEDMNTAIEVLAKLGVDPHKINS